MDSNSHRSRPPAAADHVLLVQKMLQQAQQKEEQRKREPGPEGLDKHEQREGQHGKHLRREGG